MERKVANIIQNAEAEAEDTGNQPAEEREPEDDEEELNSNDDVPEYDEDIDVGRNILLAFYKKVFLSS